MKRQTHNAEPGEVSVRDVDADGDGLFRVRMPVSSTTEARDGDSFSRDRLRGFREQIEAGDVGVFLDHGRNESTGSRYSALGKVGYWADAEVVDVRDGEAELHADAVIADPEEMGETVGEVREMLSWVRTQAELGIPLASSVGWSENTGEREVPGGADLLEISIVGIPSDPSTTTADAVTARSLRAPVPEEYSHDAMLDAKDQAEEMGIDGGAIHAHGEGDERTFMPGASHVSIIAHLREEGVLDGGRNVVEVGGEEVDLSAPDAVQNAAALALAKDDELDTDCGTGAGDTSARQIADDSVTADRIEEIAAYLTSHEEDVTADGPPTDWSNDEWEDCGNLQYAKWGGLGSGTGLEWAQSAANEVADAKDEEQPYPNRDAITQETVKEGTPVHVDGDQTDTNMTDRNIDDPEFAEGDAVQWSSQDTPVHGRVAGVHEQFSPNEDVTITGDDGEAVYSIYEWDDSLSPPAFQNSPSDPNIAKPQSSLSESQKDMPPATEENFSGNNMAESQDNDGEQTREMMEEMMERMVDMQEQQMEMLEEMYEEGHGGEEMGDDDEMEEDEGEDEDEESARTVTLDGDEKTVDEALADLREEATEAEPEEPATQDRAADEESEATDSETGGFGMAARME